AEDSHSEFNAFVADKDLGTCHELAHVMFTLSAEGAVKSRSRIIVDNVAHEYLQLVDVEASPCYYGSCYVRNETRARQSFKECSACGNTDVRRLGHGPRNGRTACQSSNIEYHRGVSQLRAQHLDRQVARHALGECGECAGRTRGLTHRHRRGRLPDG